MSIVMRLPMLVVAGTSALAIAIHSITSIANCLRLGVTLDHALLGLLLCGVMKGAVPGPQLGKYLPENGLRGLLLLVLVAIGLRYTGLF